MLTIYSFFSPTKEDVMRALQETAKNVALSPVKELESFHTDLVSNAVEAEMGNLLDISLVGVMLRAWKKYELIRKYLGKDATKSSEAVLVPLLEHTIESSHDPYIQVSRGNVPILKITFSVSLEILIEALVLKLRSGRIQEIATGQFTASGTLKCESVTIVEKVCQPLNLPGRFAIGPKDESDAEEEPLVQFHASGESLG
jgi:hypothetical protein